MSIVTGNQDRPPAASSRLSNLQQRWRTALLLGPVVLALVFLGDVWFFGLGIALAVIGGLEFCNLGRNRGIEAFALAASVGIVFVLTGLALGQPVIALAAFVVTFVVAVVRSLLRRRGMRLVLLDALMTAAPLLYLGVTAGMLILVRAAPNGLAWLVLILIITWSTDTLAFFGGRTWGNHLLAPRISPKKTVEGAITGVIGGFVISLIFLLLTGHYSPALLPLIALGPFVAVVGDLSESALKRAFHVKDSHLSHFNLFPGHGGVLDRTDSLILVAWFCYAAYALLGIVG